MTASMVGDLCAGDTCQFLGPRRSVDFFGLETPVALFGDETSFGWRRALRLSAGRRCGMRVRSV